MLALARSNFAPDFSIDYEREVPENGPSGDKLGFTLRYPLWLGRPLADLRAARAHQAFAQHRQESVRNRVFNLLETELSEVNTHYKLAKLYEESILPLAHQTLQVTQQAYTAGKTDFLKLLEAHRALLENETIYYEELWHYAEHWTLLELYAGGKL